MAVNKHALLLTTLTLLLFLTPPANADEAIKGGDGTVTSNPITFSVDNVATSTSWTISTPLDHVDVHLWASYSHTVGAAALCSVACYATAWSGIQWDGETAFGVPYIQCAKDNCPEDSQSCQVYTGGECSPAVATEFSKSLAAPTLVGNCNTYGFDSFADGNVGYDANNDGSYSEDEILDKPVDVSPGTVDVCRGLEYYVKSD